MVVSRLLGLLTLFGTPVWCGVQDYSQQRPSQELVAKDLHDTEWKFRHIYRGTPIEFIDWVSLAWGFTVGYTVLYNMLRY